MKPKEKRDFVINQLMAKENAKSEVFGTLTFITYSDKSTYICAVLPQKGFKLLYHYRFATIQEMDNFINERKRVEQINIDALAKRMLQYEKEKQQMTVGTILYSSWGCEQTNINFYVIVERKKDFVILQEVGTIKTYDKHFDDRGECVPDVTKKIGEPFRKKINNYGGVNLNTYSWCGLWDNKPKSWSSYA